MLFICCHKILQSIRKILQSWNMNFTLWTLLSSFLPRITWSLLFWARHWVIKYIIISILFFESLSLWSSFIKNYVFGEDIVGIRLVLFLAMYISTMSLENLSGKTVLSSRNWDNLIRVHALWTAATKTNRKNGIDRFFYQIAILSYFCSSCQCLP